MRLDADVAAVSPSSVYRVLNGAGLMQRHYSQPSLKGQGFQRPLRPHEPWHVDVSYSHVAETSSYLASLPDGCSRSIVHGEIREAMTEADLETILRRARERYPDARPRISFDNGPRSIAVDVKEFIRLRGMTHGRTSPYSPRSNGKIERRPRSLKAECSRPGVPLSPEDARRLVEGFVRHDNIGTSPRRPSWPAWIARSSRGGIASWGGS